MPTHPHPLRDDDDDDGIIDSLNPCACWSCLPNTHSYTRRRADSRSPTSPTMHDHTTGLNLVSIMALRKAGAAAVGKVNPATTYFLLCDIQERFRDAIYHFPQVICSVGRPWMDWEVLIGKRRNCLSRGMARRLPVVGQIKW